LRKNRCFATIGFRRGQNDLIQVATREPVELFLNVRNAVNHAFQIVLDRWAAFLHFVVHEGANKICLFR